MAGYGTDGGMTDLLLAMKEQAQQDRTYLKYVQYYRIKRGGWWWAPWDKHALYFSAVGSPEEEIGEGASGAAAGDVVAVKRARHIVNVECVVPFSAPESEDMIVGRTNTIKGLTDFVGDVCDFFENNWLGLDGLDKGIPPIIQAPEGAYQEVEMEDRMFLYMAVLRYEAATKPFIRTDNG